MCFYQRVDSRLDAPVGAAGAGLGSRLNVVLVHPGDFVGIALQPGAHVGGHVVGVDAAAVAIAEDGEGAVVVGNDDETLVVSHVEDIETADRAFQCQLGCGTWGSVACRYLTLHKVLGLF